MPNLLHKACLRWCRQHVHWNLNVWRHVMSSDESRFCLRHLDRRVEVWRRRGEPCADCYTDRVASFGGGSVMVGDGISLSGKGRGLSSLEAISIQRDIKMRFCNQWQSHISTVWDQTLSSKMTTLPTTERGLSETTSCLQT